MKVFSKDQLAGMEFSPVGAPNGVVRVKDQDAAKRLGLEADKDYRVTFVSSQGTASYEQTSVSMGSGSFCQSTYRVPIEMRHEINLESVKGRFPLYEFAIMNSGRGK